MEAKSNEVAEEKKVKIMEVEEEGGDSKLSIM
jgi:hypothetical protein